MAQFIVLNTHKYQVYTTFANKYQLTCSIIPDGIDLDTLQADAIAHQKDVKVYDELSALVYTYKGFNEFAYMQSRGSAEGIQVVFNQIYNYEQSLTILCGEPISVSQARDYRQAIWVMACYAPEDLILNNKWAVNSWGLEKAYWKGAVVNYYDNLYRCLRNHICEEGNNPVADPEVWQLIEGGKK